MSMNCWSLGIATIEVMEKKLALVYGVGDEITICDYVEARDAGKTIAEMFPHKVVGPKAQYVIDCVERHLYGND